LHRLIENDDLRNATLSDAEYRRKSGQGVAI